MQFNLRFIITLILIVLIILSFVMIILEMLSFNSRALYELKDSTGAKVVKFKDIAVNDTIKVTKLGTPPEDLVSNTQYYRYSSLILHVLAALSGVYIIYTG